MDVQILGAPGAIRCSKAVSATGILSPLPTDHPTLRSSTAPFTWHPRHLLPQPTGPADGVFFFSSLMVKFSPFLQGPLMTHPTDSCLLEQILNMQAITSEDLPALWQQGALTFPGMRHPSVPQYSWHLLWFLWAPLIWLHMGQVTSPSFPRKRKGSKGSSIMPVVSKGSGIRPFTHYTLPRWGRV